MTIRTLPRVIKRYGKTYVGYLDRYGRPIYKYVENPETVQPLVRPQAGFHERDTRLTYAQLALERINDIGWTRIRDAWKRLLIEVISNKLLDTPVEKLHKFVPQDILQRIADELHACAMFSHFYGYHAITTHLRRATYLHTITEYFQEIAPIGVTPRQALRDILSRIPVTREEFDDIDEHYRSRLFTIAHITCVDEIYRVQRKLAEAIAQGQTLEQFRNAVRREEVTGLTDFHLETVFRTNIQNAYQSGQWMAIEENRDIIAALEYHAILDDRVRPTHAQMHGTVAPVDDPIWSKWTPPNGYNCRCSLIPVTRYENLERRVPRQPPEPDRGFGHHPLIGPFPEQLIERARQYNIPIPPNVRRMNDFYKMWENCTTRGWRRRRELNEYVKYNLARTVFIDQNLAKIVNSNTYRIRLGRLPARVIGKTNAREKAIIINTLWVERREFPMLFVTMVHELAHSYCFRIIIPSVELRIRWIQLYYDYADKMIELLRSIPDEELTSWQRRLRIRAIYDLNRVKHGPFITSCTEDTIGFIETMIERYGWNFPLRGYGLNNAHELIAVTAEILATTKPLQPRLHPTCRIDRITFRRLAPDLYNGIKMLP